jgi:hypothetical protein
MNKALLSASAAILTVVGITATFATASADPGGGAIVIQDQVCGVPVFSGPSGPPIGSVLVERRTVYSPSGNAMFVCSGEVPEALRPNRAVVRRLRCTTTLPLPAPPNGEGQITLTPSGRITGICHNNPSNDD